MRQSTTVTMLWAWVRCLTESFGLIQGGSQKLKLNRVDTITVAMHTQLSKHTKSL